MAHIYSVKLCQNYRNQTAIVKDSLSQKTGGIGLLALFAAQCRLISLLRGTFRTLIGPIASYLLGLKGHHVEKY